MDYPSWWVVKPRNQAKLEARGIHTSRQLLAAATGQSEHGELEITTEQLFHFCNEQLDRMLVKVWKARFEEGVSGTRRVLRMPGCDYGWSEDEWDTFPPECYCPLSLAVFEDPVVASDGHTYERAIFETWMKTKTTSPLTGGPLETKICFPNHTMKAYIARLSC